MLSIAHFRICAVCAAICLSISAVSEVIATDARPINVTTTVDRSGGTVGDQIQLTFVVRYDSSLRIVPVYPDSMLGAFDVLGDSLLDEARPEDGLLVYEHRWRLAAFRPDTFWIPSISGALIDSLGERVLWRTDSIAIAIASVLTAAADTMDIRGLKDPYVAPDPLSAWWYALAGLVVAGLLALYLFKRRRGPVGESEKPTVPPWESALLALETMRNEMDPQTDGARNWYFRLSEILRRYLDGRFGWNTIDQTTSEIDRHLKKESFQQAHRKRVCEFLGVADLVRYARTPPTAERPDIDWDWMQDFVNATTPATTVSEDGRPGDPSNDPEADRAFSSSRVGETGETRS